MKFIDNICEDLLLTEKERENMYNKSFRLEGRTMTCMRCNKDITNEYNPD